MAKPVRSIKITAAKAKKLNAAVGLLEEHVANAHWAELTGQQRQFLLDNSPVLKRLYDLTRDMHLSQPHPPVPGPDVS